MYLNSPKKFSSISIQFKRTVWEMTVTMFKIVIFQCFLNSLITFFVVPRVRLFVVDASFLEGETVAELCGSF